MPVGGARDRHPGAPGRARPEEVENDKTDWNHVGWEVRQFPPTVRTHFALISVFGDPREGRWQGCNTQQGNCNTRHKSLPVSRQRHPKKSQPQPATEDFWTTKAVEELAAEQGVQPVARLEDVLGKGQDLWRDDAELDSFLAAIRERRHPGG